MNIQDKAKLLNSYIKEWFSLNNKTDAKPKDLMPYLVEKGIYKKDNRDGNPLRNDLRKLKKFNKLDLIEYLEIIQKEKNTYWYFRKKC